MRQLCPTRRFPPPSRRMRFERALPGDDVGGRRADLLVGEPPKHRAKDRSGTPVPFGWCRPLGCRLRGQGGLSAVAATDRPSRLRSEASSVGNASQRGASTAAAVRGGRSRLGGPSSRPRLLPAPSRRRSLKASHDQPARRPFELSNAGLPLAVREQGLRVLGRRLMATSWATFLARRSQSTPGRRSK